MVFQTVTENNHEKVGFSFKTSVDIIRLMGNNNSHLSEGLDSAHRCVSAHTLTFLSSLDIRLYKLPHVKTEVSPCLRYGEN